MRSTVIARAPLSRVAQLGVSPTSKLGGRGIRCSPPRADVMARQDMGMPVHYEVNDRVATVTIDRPEAMNALDPPMLFGLAEAWDKAEEDDDVWVVVVTGAGDEAFCVGADLKTTIPATAASARGEGGDAGTRCTRSRSWRPSTVTASRAVSSCCSRPTCATRRPTRRSAFRRCVGACFPSPARQCACPVRCRTAEPWRCC
ncbi:MAG: enoyl-CoA hydratase/isomerase family protein, partial [Actinobacteria bacterium]